MGAVKIEGFDIIKKLFSANNGLTVYVVKQKNQLSILRLADYSNNKDGLTQSKWYEIYEDYQLNITNYKNLPRVSTISMLNDSQVYALVDYEEGKPLSELGQLGLDATHQLIAAVRHLHSKKFVHGSIIPENIWVTNDGKVILYGAGEYKALESAKEHRQSSDIKQLSSLIQSYSNIDEGDLEKLTIDNPTSIDELESMMANAKEAERKPEKSTGGLVEKEKPKPTKEVSTPTDVEEKKEQPKVEQVEPQKPVTEEQQEQPTRSEQTEQEKTRYVKPKNKFVSTLKKLGIGVVSVLALLFVIGLFVDSDDTNTSVEPAQTEVANEVEEVAVEETSAAEVAAPEETEPAEPVQQEKPVPSFTQEQVVGFMNQYSAASIQAVNDRNFAVVENLIDPSGDTYNTQREYIDYLESKGITEEIISFQVDDFTKVDASTYKVSTYEQYYIYYQDGSVNEKGFNSSYIIKVLGDNSLAVNKLLYTEETYSETVREATDYSYEEDSYYEDTFYSEDTSAYLAGTDSYPVESSDDTGAIESAVRLHYGSISSDDFDTAYNQFSSKRKSKVTQKGWVKGLQANMYDELTYIEVQQIEDNKGRAYIEMTSYDDNSDGTTLVQQWSGYWHLVKEGGRWTLDDPELSKVGSWVEAQ